MAKVKYNVKGVDRGGSYEQPKPGLYEMEIGEAELRDTDGKNDIKLKLVVTKNNDECVGAICYTYVNLGESSQWKLAEFTDALGLPETGTLDTAKLKGKKLKVKINPDSFDGNYQARAGRFSPLSAEAEDGDDDPDAAGTEDDDPDAAGTDEPVVIELNDVELSSDPDYYDDWSEQDAIDEIENQGLKLGKKAKNKKNVVAALIELVLAQAAEPEATDDDDDAEGGDEYDDTDTWSDAELAAEYKKRGLETIEGKKNRAKVIAALRADDADDDDPFAD